MARQVVGESANCLPNLFWVRDGLFSLNPIGFQVNHQILKFNGANHPSSHGGNEPMFMTKSAYYRKLAKTRRAVHHQLRIRNVRTVA